MKFNMGKDYNDALERCKEVFNMNNLVYSPSEIEAKLKYVFPQLETNEDERIKQKIIKLIKKSNEVGGYALHKWEADEMLAWLEKQGKQKETLCDKCKKEQPSHSCQDITALGRCYIEGISTSNKVKPKFKVGDWIKHNKANFIFQINKVTSKNYEFNNPDGYNHSLPIKSVDEKYHLWTIADAKDGDVLAAEDKDKVFLYNGKLDLRGRICAYCGIYKTYDGLRFTKCAIGNYFTYKEPYPATKEQRDLLFQKMEEAGYEWDAEKKE